jgi:UDP-N-acetylmuramyl pentapeptide phosphotransferase/UDP-N-acetylglucosamine-1-phosphate transferase
LNLWPIMVATNVVALVTAALLSFGLIRLLRPLLVRYALARPNARSSHTVPTPQGGGIAVVGAALIVGLPAVLAMGGLAAMPGFAVLAAGTLALALLGAVDDIRPLPALPRLLVQLAVVAAVIACAGDGRILPEAVPFPLEYALLVLAGVWWVNLVNFMDGIDWITIAEFVPMTACLAFLGLSGDMGPVAGTVAAILCGALLGFAPANRPVARLFLGDVGSLPLGLVSGWLLLSLAAAGHLAAALLLPLYYLADATLTLLRRAARGERVWEAHRSHFYQRATGNGLSVLQVDLRILWLNLGLSALAGSTIAWPSVAIPALAVGTLLVAFVLWLFATPRARSV